MANPLVKSGQNMSMDERLRSPALYIYLKKKKKVLLHLNPAFSKCMQTSSIGITPTALVWTGCFRAQSLERNSLAVLFPLDHKRLKGKTSKKI